MRIITIIAFFLLPVFQVQAIIISDVENGILHISGNTGMPLEIIDTDISTELGVDIVINHDDDISLINSSLVVA